MPLLVRTWNVFHGSAASPERAGYLEEMVRLAVADGPDVVCLQELPVWALDRLEVWSGMAAVCAVAAPPRLGPLPWPAELGRRVTAANQGLLRSAFTGQANGVLVARRLRVLDTETLVLNARRFRAAQARWLGLDLVARLAWAKERRVCQAVRIGLPDRGTALVGNLHATSYPADERLADAELRRAATFLEGLARPEEPLVLCGDANVLPGRSRTLHDLVADGFSNPAPGIDHVLARGFAAAAPQTWPDERRRVAGRLLSDHAPVEVMLK
ncbi:MAG TPA: endonuclease/exonuclease/phosphatase family protein [Gaiellaceae bacterium]|nr:endonuclease/exonuclease/phosphatase family protein [Gaiellaceae bacterium]